MQMTQLTKVLPLSSKYQFDNNLAYRAPLFLGAFFVSKYPFYHVSVTRHWHWVTGRSKLCDLQCLQIIDLFAESPITTCGMTRRSQYSGVVYHVRFLPWKAWCLTVPHRASRALTPAINLSFPLLLPPRSHCSDGIFAPMGFTHVKMTLSAREVWQMSKVHCL